MTVSKGNLSVGEKDGGKRRGKMKESLGASLMERAEPMYIIRASGRAGDAIYLGTCTSLAAEYLALLPSFRYSHERVVCQGLGFREGT